MRAAPRRRRLPPQLQCRKRDGSRPPNRVGPGPKKKSPGAGIAEARTHYTERTTTQTKYNRAHTECLGPMAVLRRFLVDLAFNNKDLGGSPHSPWLIVRRSFAPSSLALVRKPVPCILPASSPKRVEVA